VVSTHIFFKEPQLKQKQKQKQKPQLVIIHHCSLLKTK
jgi:hypothetical protein